MHLIRSALTLSLSLCVAQSCLAYGHDELCAINSKLQGRVLDFTRNHGRDNRIWSQALCQKRDVYVYVPPCYDPCKAYSFAIYMHGAMEDETSFVRNIVQHFDEAIVAGQVPPFIIVAPDGSIQGRPSLLRTASFWVNSLAGRFEDYVQQDVWDFVHCNFRIRPEREAHALIGASMGGTGAFGQGIKYRDRYRVIVGVFPAVNLRWVDCRGHYMAKFDPNNWGWRNRMNPLEVVGRPLGTPFKVRAGELYCPVAGMGEGSVARLSSFNPIEMIDRYCLSDGELSMYIGYVGCDEFNIDTQVNSFLYLAACRGIHITTEFNPCAHHNVEGGLTLLPGILTWICPQVLPPIRFENCLGS